MEKIKATRARSKPPPRGGSASDRLTAAGPSKRQGVASMEKEMGTLESEDPSSQGKHEVP